FRFTADFFFQAEDGIRDFHGTGVQTCALPISRRGPADRLSPSYTATAKAWRSDGAATSAHASTTLSGSASSEVARTRPGSATHAPRSDRRTRRSLSML